ncbi:hypothetical protein TI03_02320 [Achromatium sp. WMS1]|nr:hypothetical protein TI03_02320 [Achromatium sp. WMS1]
MDKHQRTPQLYSTINWNNYQEAQRKCSISLQRFIRCRCNGWLPTAKYKSHFTTCHYKCHLFNEQNDNDHFLKYSVIQNSTANNTQKIQQTLEKHGFPSGDSNIIFANIKAWRNNTQIYETKQIQLNWQHFLIGMWHNDWP